MAKLTLNIVGNNKALNYMTVNNRFVKIKKNRNKTRTCELELDKDSAQINIEKTHHYVGKNWFWWNLLYFIVSFFGLFDDKQDRRCHVIEYVANIEVKQDTILNLTIQNYEEGGKFLVVEGATNIEEVKNIQYCDREAVKKHNKMKKTKKIITIATLVAVAVLALVIVL